LTGEVPADADLRVVVAARFGIGEITATRVITAGRMNLNWQVTTTHGVGGQAGPWGRR
jgi:hypothetical protein